MNEKLCINCEYFDYEEGDANGFCRRFPPFFVVDGHSHFVGVGNDSWCGEHKERVWYE